MNKKYDDFFQNIKNFNLIRQKQKMRGLNDYNMVNIVRNEMHEVGMHSNIIYSLIDPDGIHYQGDLFLNFFVEYVIEPYLIGEIKNYDGFGVIYDVQREESTDENRRIDFTIKSNKFIVGIEMKINARDLNDQISHYNEYLKTISL